MGELSRRDIHDSAIVSLGDFRRFVSGVVIEDYSLEVLVSLMLQSFQNAG